jgi:molecular chaperone GrpE
MPEGDNKTENEDASAEEALAAEEDAERAAAADLEAEAEAEVEAETPAIPEPEAALLAEVATLKDQLLRALAETENLRRRHQRERENALKYAAVPFMRDLIGVVDNLRRAMSSVSSEAQEADEHLKTLMAGLEMTEKELATVFERHHIVKIDPLGERLDPHSHEAMFEVPDPETPSGTVVQVVQAGYRLHDRLLRPAQVGVAKGGPAPAPQPRATAAPPATAAPQATATPEPREPKPEPQGAPEAAGNDDETPPGSTVDTSA